MPAWRSAARVYSSRPARVTMTKSQSAALAQKKPMMALLPFQEPCSTFWRSASDMASHSRR